MASNQKQGPPHIKDLKDLRAFCVSACYRHLGPKGPNRLSFGCACAQTGQDQASLTYRAWGPAIGCDRLIATGQDQASLPYRAAAVRSPCRLRSPDRNRSRSGDLNLQREAPRVARKSAGDRPPRYGILPLYRRARACPSPLLENAITVRGTGPRATVFLTFSARERLFFPLEFTKRHQRTIRCGDRPRQHPRD